MKKIIFSLLAATLFLFGCEKEEVPTLGIADFSVHVGGQERPTAGNIAINNYITFLDISRNAIDHEWRIDEGSFFLSDGFTATDTSFNEYIITGAGRVSTEQKVNVLFTESGLHPVQIFNTFEQEPTEGPATPIQQGGKWVIDTTFMIDVFDNLQPAFKVFKDDVEILNVSASDVPDPANSSTWPIIEVEAGQTLTFVDVTTIGRPNNRTWNLGGAVPSGPRDSVATVSYFSLGDFIGGSFNSERGGERPAQEANKTIPIQIKVIPSSEPFLFVGNLEEQADQTITFTVGGELAAFSGQESAFTVNVSNNGFNDVIPVDLAKVSDSDATKIELTLSAPIYNSDLITVSYSGSEIKSADFRTLSDFGPEEVAMYFEESVIPSDWGGFEVGDANWKKGFASGFWVGNSNGGAAMPIFSRTEEMSAEGIACMKIDLYNGVENKTLQGSDFKNFGLAAGGYVIKMKLFLPEGNTMTSVNTIVQTPFTTLEWDITNLPRGEWVEVSQVQIFDIAPTKRYDFKINPALNEGVIGAQVIFIDSYEFIPYEVR